MSPGLSAGDPLDGSGRHADAVGRRLAAYVRTDDLRLLLDPGAETEAAALLDAAVRSVVIDMRIDVQPWLWVLRDTGWLFWLRAQTDTQRNPLRDRDLSLALVLLAPLCDAAPSSVPTLVLESTPASEPPGTPQVDVWNSFAVQTVGHEGKQDRTVLLAATAVTQLGIVMAEDTTSWAGSTGNTVHSLLLLHEYDSDPDFLAGAVNLARQLVTKTPADRPEHLRYLMRLCETLRFAYAAHREPQVLAEAIGLARSVVAKLPSDDTRRPDAFNHLTGLLSMRHTDFGDSESLREAVSLSRALVAELPAGHPARARELNNLARELEKFLYTDDAAGAGADPTVLDEIIALGQEALDILTVDNDPDLGTTIRANLARWLGLRARRGGAHRSANDTAVAERLARQAHNTTRDRPTGAVLEALTGSLDERYARTRDPAALAEAVTALRDGLAKARGPAEQTSRRFLLGAALNNRYAEYGGSEDAREAAALLREVAKSATENIQRRLDCAYRAGKLEINLEDWPSAADDFALAIRLLPDLTGWQLHARDREQRLQAYTPLPMLAATSALAAGSPTRALEALEQGRGVLHSEVSAVRVDLDRLHAEAPGLATALEGLPTRLRSTSEADQRHLLAEERQQLIEEIRHVPGFENFLQPPQLKEILDACREGPVVIPMFGTYGSDALLVTRDGVRRLRLPRLKVDTVRRLNRDLIGGAELALDSGVSRARRNLGEYSLRTGLALLWDTVVEPVLDALRDDLCQPESGATGPRLWWCPIGLLSYFPLHMAERREEGSAFALTVSSYTPSIHSLGRLRPWSPSPDSRPLVVALPRTPGASDLPAADEEAAVLTDAFPNARLLRGPAATRERLLAALPDHDIVHIACHAGHDVDRHYESHLAMYDGRVHISDIASTRTGGAGLAFLSACGTARNRLDLPDESLNILSAFQLAGFSHLIGSLWPVADQANTRLVTAFYKHLAQDRSASVAESLHHAVSELRDREPERPSLWTPHLHVGP